WSTAPKSMGLLDQILAEAALDVLAVALRAEVLVAVDDDLAAREHGVDVPVDLEALPGGVVHVHVVGLVDTYGGVPVRVVDHDIRVGAGLDDALLPVHPEHPRGGRRGHLDPALERDVALDDAL